MNQRLETMETEMKRLDSDEVFNQMATRIDAVESQLDCLVTIP